MSTVLLLTRSPGPAEAQVFSSLRNSGHEIHVLDVNGQWFRGGKRVPLWMKGYRLRRSALATSYMTQFIESKGVDRVIALGLEAAAFAAENVVVPFIPWLMRGSLDFSSARTGLADDFAVLNTATDRLLLDDEWEMDKAGAKDSTVAHLLTPLLLGDGQPVLSDDSGTRVALIHPHAMDSERVETYRENLSAALDGAEAVPVEAESLYRGRDLSRDRLLAPTLRTRLEGYSHAVFVGTSRHYSAVLGSLTGQWDRVIVEETIGNGNLARDLGLPRVARGLRISAELQRMVAGGSPATVAERTASPRTVDHGDDLLSALDRIMERTVARDFEELAALQGTDPLDVFYSVAPLQDRTNGARPQRIRNMAEAFDRPEAAIRLYSSGGGFRRRAEAVHRLIAEGRPIGVFYGENSTSPIASTDAVDDLERLMDEIRQAGGRCAWFVRDLHWLDEVDGYLDDEEMRSELTARGLQELRQIGDRAEMLLAPSEASGDGFNRLLTTHGETAREWVPLPPAVAGANVVDAGDIRPVAEGTTLLYAGGMNSVYGMDDYLAAVSDGGTGYLLDFVVREEEADYLRTCLGRHGLLDQERVRILTVPLDLYRPRTAACLGIVLLDSDYARFSFPYKTVSMIERGFPVLCYQDMGIADFVREHRVGLGCDRTAESIREGIEQLVADGAPGLDHTRTSETWDHRVRTVREGLAGQL
mgnify:CR=1 FL=1